MAEIRFQNLMLGYDRKPALRGLSGVIGPGSLVALVGPNGAGKSTLLKGMAGQLPPLAGRIEIAGLRRKDFGYVPQQASIDRSFPLSVFDMAAMGLWRSVGLFGSLTGGPRRRVSEALATCGLGALEARPIGSLSGGQFQRMLFARLLLQDAPLILLDEPFTAIDAATIADLMALILRWHAEGRTIVAALHDLAQVRAHFPQTLLLAREAVAWGKTGDVLTPANLARARRLCEGRGEEGEVVAFEAPPLRRKRP